MRRCGECVLTTRRRRGCSRCLYPGLFGASGAEIANAYELSIFLGAPSPSVTLSSRPPAAFATVIRSGAA